MRSGVLPRPFVRPTTFPASMRREAKRYNAWNGRTFTRRRWRCSGRGGTTASTATSSMIAPATDDRPYFFHFFKWSTPAGVAALKEGAALPLLEWGYPVLVATLVQA